MEKNEIKELESIIANHLKDVDENMIGYTIALLEDQLDEISKPEDLKEKIGDILIENSNSFSNDKEILKLCKGIFIDMYHLLPISKITETTKPDLQDDAEDEESEEDEVIYYKEDIERIEQEKRDRELAEKYGCKLCERIIPLTFHHLIPRTTHRKMMKRGYEKSELNKGIWICRPCHSGIHAVIPEMEMALNYYSLEKLLEHEGVLKVAKYYSKK